MNFSVDRFYNDSRVSAQLSNNHYVSTWMACNSNFTNWMFEVVNDIRFHLDLCHSISPRRKQASACLPCRRSPLKIPSPILQFCPSGPDRHPKAVRRSLDRESLERAAKEVLFNDSNMLMLTLWRRNKSQISFRYLFANREDSSLQFRGGGTSDNFVIQVTPLYLITWHRWFLHS